MQFQPNGFPKFLLLVVMKNSGGILLHKSYFRLVRKKYHPKWYWDFYIKMELKNNSWLLCCIYDLHKSLWNYHLQEISNELEFHSANFENVSLIGDFISEITDTDMKSFLQLWRPSIGYAPTIKSHRILLLSR